MGVADLEDVGAIQGIRQGSVRPALQRAEGGVAWCASPVSTAADWYG